MKTEIEIRDISVLTEDEKLCYLYCYYIFSMGIYPTIKLCNERLGDLSDWVSVSQRLILKGYLVQGSKQDWLVPVI